MKNRNLWIAPEEGRKRRIIWYHIRMWADVHLIATFKIEDSFLSRYPAVKTKRERVRKMQTRMLKDHLDLLVLLLQKAIEEDQLVINLLVRYLYNNFPSWPNRKSDQNQISFYLDEPIQHLVYLSEISKFQALNWHSKHACEL